MPTPAYILDLRHAYGQGRLLLPGVTAVVVRHDLIPGRTHVLLHRRSDTGRWCLPSGIVEPDEQPAVTVVREVAEETGVEVAVERLVLLVTDPEIAYGNGDRCQFVSMTFRCRYVAGEAVVADEESTEVGWFAAEGLPELDDQQRRRLAAGLSESAACEFEPP